MNGLTRLLQNALEEILEEATSDRDWDIIITAARGALDAILDAEEADDELPF